MSSYKTVNGDYELNCLPTYGNGIATGQLGTFTINANLIVRGDIINTQPQVQTQPFITVAGNNNGLIHNMGLLGQTNSNTFAGLRFNTDAANGVGAWQVSTSVDSIGNPIDAYLTIATGNIAVAGSNTQIQFNNQGDFGGAANLNYIPNGGQYTGNTSVLAVSGLEKLINIGLSAQGNTYFTANATYLFSNPAQSGGTGLYFVSPDPGDPVNGIEDELISKTKAIVYSIIF